MNKKTVVFLFSICLMFILSNCRISSSEVQAGYQLSKQYCTGCHLYTPVEMLDKTSWSSVLTVMKKEMAKSGMAVNRDDWIAIYQYYLNEAPVALARESEDLPEIIDSQVDTLISSDILPTSVTALTCTDTGSIIIGSQQGGLFLYDQKVLIELNKVQEVPVQINQNEDELLVLSMGRMGPSNEPFGKLQSVANQSVSTIIDSLIRPIHFSTIDFNRDGYDDYVIASFGSTMDTLHTGGVSIYSGLSPHNKIADLSNRTGAVKTIVDDYNGDGLPDIYALFAQGDEQLVVFENLGNGLYKEQQLIRLSPLYGSNDFVLVDWNNSGQKDIILANGDNADYSQIFKPYHGIRIFRRNKKGGYDQHIFYPLNGAASIELNDLNRDGQLDFLATSMYPDLFAQPYEQITAFINLGNDRFKRRAFANEAMHNTAITALCTCKEEKTLKLYSGANDFIQRSMPPAMRSKFARHPKPIITFTIDEE